MSKILNYKPILFSLFLGSVTSWLIKEEITLLLFGKNFNARSELVQIGILSSLIVVTSILFLCLTAITGRFFSKILLNIFGKLKTTVNKIYNLKSWFSESLREGGKLNATGKKIYKLISFIKMEIVSHFHLLHVDKNKISKYFSSPYRIILICIFSILFLPHVFVVVRDINFVKAFEVDPGVIIDTIISLYQNHYNMNLGWGSTTYGWTYYSINFFLLAPVYIAQQLKLIPNDYYFFMVGLRFVFFMIGLSSILAYFEIAARIFKNGLLAFTATLLLIASPAVFRWFWFLHPESTGLLFLFLGILCLLRFNDGEGKDYRWYTFGLIFLVLSALSKQIFFFTALPVVFLFYYIYCHYHNVSIVKFAISRQFAKIFFSTIFLATLVFFIIHPYAFIQPQVLISKNIENLSIHAEAPIGEAIWRWLEIIKTMPIIFISIILLPFTLLGAAILERDRKVGKNLYFVNIIAAVFCVALIVIIARLYIIKSYFSPVYPFFIINFLWIPLYIVRKWSFRILKIAIIIPLIYFLFFILVTDFSASIPESLPRLTYKDQYMYKVYTYIEEEIPSGSKIVHDQHVAIPADKGITACHFWQGCGTDYIEEFAPDYVIFNENYGGLEETLRLRQYVSDHDFILVDTIDLVSIYKKPDP